MYIFKAICCANSCITCFNPLCAITISSKLDGDKQYLLALIVKDVLMIKVSAVIDNVNLQHGTCMHE